MLILVHIGESHFWIIHIIFSDTAFLPLQILMSCSLIRSAESLKVYTQQFHLCPLLKMDFTKLASAKLATKH